MTLTGVQQSLIAMKRSNNKALFKNVVVVAQFCSEAYPSQRLKTYR